jgi:hypothetical protein
MDRKTLEYMEVRVNKALEIIKEIEKMQGVISNINKGVEDISFSSFEFNFVEKIRDKAFIKIVSEKFVEMANAEIEQLEKELAEL